MSKLPKPTVPQIAEDLARVGTELEIQPQFLTEKQYLDNGGVFTEHQLKNAGGINLIKKSLFPNTEKDLKSIHQLKSATSYTQKLESKLGAKLSTEELVLEAIKGLKLDIKLPKLLSSKEKKNEAKVEMVAMLNDLHIGLIVDPAENNGLNKFDFTEAGRRVALYCLEVANYKKYKRSRVSKLHLILNGDLSHGLIHGTSTHSQHLLINQNNGLLHILVHAVRFLAQYYSEIEIYYTVGNHGRVIHKEHGKRPTSEFTDDYENIAFYALSAVFASEKRLRFHAPKTPYGFIDLPAGRCMFTHGHTIFSKALGNVGRAINVKGLGDEIRKFNAGEVMKGRKPVVLVLMAHGHTYMHVIIDGVEVIEAPSLSGADGFSHSVIGSNDSMSAQIVFESTPDYIFGDSRLVRLGDADKNADLDKIIPVFKKEIVWSGK